MRLSPTEHSNPYENAVAERINGILKYEFGLVQTVPDLRTSHKMVSEAKEAPGILFGKLIIFRATMKRSHNIQS